jgi:carboxymethylenebutenolidase
MPDDFLPFDKTKDPVLSRRAFAALSIGMGASVATPAIASDRSVDESDVIIRMADGSCDAVLFYPSGGESWPGTVIFADALGLRPSFREMGRRLAAEGYVVLVPNPFFRTRRAPVLSGPFDFGKPEDRAKLTELMAPLTTETKTRDGAAYVAYLDALPQVNKKAPIGLSGYCMGGPYTILTAAAVPERVSAAGSFHGATWSLKSPTAHICWSPRSRQASISQSQPTTISASPTPRTNCARPLLPRSSRPRSKSTRAASTVGVSVTEWSTTKPKPIAHSASCWRCTRRLSLNLQSGRP